MTVRLSFRNRQRTRPLDLAQLRRVVRDLLTTEFPTRRAELCFHLVAAPEMARVNQTFLQHAGSTDVITFNHAGTAPADSFHGEVFICLDDAVAQAKQFRTTWSWNSSATSSTRCCICVVTTTALRRPGGK